MTDLSNSALDKPALTLLTGVLKEDSKRVRVTVELSDASSHPDIELALLDEARNEITRSVILGVLASHLEFTLHLRSAVSSALFVSAVLKGVDGQVIDQKLVPVTL